MRETWHSIAHAIAVGARGDRRNRLHAGIVRAERPPRGGRGMKAVARVFPGLHVVDIPEVGRYQFEQQ
jgi:hypothetical protein